MGTAGSGSVYPSPVARLNSHCSAISRVFVMASGISFKRYVISLGDLRDR